jgi:hypothetical protein
MLDDDTLNGADSVCKLTYWGSNPGSRYIDKRSVSKTNVLTTTLYNRASWLVY